ncbi:hypothetical protein MMAD_31040 [Mycolicibacterium madagascariense]|uniref:Uncharacterized protein n=1 Tax=Mycolicibacterium madagascariense TaxID=212765 RepID=A0A7I7XHY7_9MYCO|nr:hypothetical protein [Mycolicibacterium madagascariense]MCV7015821.1 hypothetical protein [Mycolicibacterium madagascariense]BBZ28809.1 hypothetical protein MMAD_31040 [Mycolicibacterium madagascariense]
MTCGTYSQRSLYLATQSAIGAKSQGSVDPSTELPNYAGFLDGQFLPAAA